ncbi:MAG TPA: HAMP domain-containing sensor histidine kinase, partial [bacterium]|nr:HAMP domain-containing sensor histidine kinase [bacterium]
AAKLVDKAKSEFVSVASHQLRTPLSIINWYLELLESGDSGVLDTEQRTFVEEIAKSSKRMVMLVNTLLDVSRLELGSLKLDEKLTDVSAVVAHAVNELHYKVEEQKLKVITEFAKIPKIFLDDRHFESVVQNIFANALKYTPEGGEVRLRVVESAAGETFGGKKLSQASIAVEISDTGYGIPKQQQDKIFDKFFRADNVLDKDEPGTGLGLYIAKSVIEAMGGNIWFVSREGKGSTFYITVPKRTENK